MRITAFAGSSSRNSINKQLVEYTVKFFTGSDIKVLDLNDYEMPLFSVDTEKRLGPQDKAKQFLAEIKQADFLIISLAEHNGSYTVAFKNIFDWCSRIEGKVFQDKPMLLMATSDGKRGGRSVLESAKTKFPFMGADIKAVFSFPSFHQNFDKELGIINEELKNDLMQIVQSIKL